MSDLLFNGPDDGPMLVLAHGSGAPMDSAFMDRFSEFAGDEGIRVVRFEFGYMARRRTTGKKPPPPKAEKLIDEFLAVVKQLGTPRIFIGGKSLGGRVASMMAQQCFEDEVIAGLVCLGYPFHPPGKPESLRTAHFANYTCPSLICQGERDPFGKREEIAAYSLPSSFEFHWGPFGNHDLAPPKRSGLTSEDNWQAAAKAVAAFMRNHTF